MCGSQQGLGEAGGDMTIPLPALPRGESRVMRRPEGDRAAMVRGLPLGRGLEPSTVPSISRALWRRCLTPSETAVSGEEEAAAS